VSQNPNQMNNDGSNMAYGKQGGRMLLIASGFWYSSACLMTRQSGMSMDGDDMWCTLYLRMHDPYKSEDNKR